MRDHLVLIINGARHQVSGRDGFLTLSDYLRRRQGLVGTKIVCSEGDCGACTVLVGRRTGGDGRWTYCPVDACIQLMFQLDGVHVVTVEGLRPGGELTAVQQAMVECHGSQCGFCTPGFVMAMAGAQELAAGETLDLDDWRQSLAGNLCRCTGYVPILDAAEQATAAGDGCLNEAYPAAELEALLPSDEEPIELNWRDEFEQLHAACPATLAEALAWLAQHPGARIVAGATDVGVRVNKTGRLPAEILDLNRVEELRGVRVENGLLVAGARATWSDILAACGDALPELARILTHFGGPQIRHVGTIGGNLANASPIADSLPLLCALDATLVLANAAGRRELNINDFYLGYKQLALDEGELIAEVRTPLPAPDQRLRLYKVSRRLDLDISTFTAALCLTIRDDAVAGAAIALGGVGPVVLRARRTEQFLVGRPWSEETMRAAGELAADETTPITDVRGAADYRRQLARNVFLKYFHQTQQELASV